MKKKLAEHYNNISGILKDIFKRSMNDNIMGLGAQMSYYFILAFFPFLIFLIALLSYTNITSEDVLRSLSPYLPTDVYNIVISVVKETVKSTSTTLLSFGALGTLWGASNAVETLIIGINSAYDLTETRPYWKIKLLSLLFTIAMALIYIFSLVMIVFGGVMAEKVFDFFQMSALFIYLWNVSRVIIPVVTIFIAFIFMYNYMPVRRMGFRKILPGVIFSTVAWMLISQIFSFYMNNFGSYTKAYGSLGSIIVLLLWLYWCGIVIMLGAEIIASLYYSKEIKDDSNCKFFK